jgi:hypothetical protein
MSERGGASLFTNQGLFMKLANGKTLSDDQVNQRLVRQYRKIEALHLDGACDHPSTVAPKEWPGILRGTRTATDNEPDISPDPVSGQDSAPRGGVSMNQAFPGFDRVGLKFPMPPRK